MTADAPAIAVVLATRNRPASAARALDSILKSRRADVEVCVVDQTDGTGTVAALRELARDPRVRVIRSSSRGLSNARNLGAAATRAPIVAFTDDDCEVDARWLDAWVRLFARDPRIGLAFGSIVAGDYDRTAGLIVARCVRRVRLARRIADKTRIESLGACMALRRTAFDAIRGFDDQLGTGAPFRAAEDTDITIRALLAGFWVCETPEAVVTHHGFRPWAESREVVEGYVFGLGAAYAKMARLGGLRAVTPICAMAWRWMARGPVADLNHHPPRLMRLRAFLRGTSAGLRAPIDPHSGRFAAGPSSGDIMNVLRPGLIGAACLLAATVVTLPAAVEGQAGFGLAGPGHGPNGAPGMATPTPIDPGRPWGWAVRAFMDAPSAPLYNTAKQKLLDGRQIYSQQIRVFDIKAYCDGAMKYDFSRFEMQHGTLRFDEVEKMIAACPRVPATPMIRIPDATESNVQKAVDAGVLGIVIPTVDDALEARQAAMYARYPPIARRSTGGSQTQGIWDPVVRKPGTFRSTINDNMLVVVMIETQEGVKNALEIASQPGVDVVIIGNADFEFFSGFPRGSEPYSELMTRVRNATYLAGKFWGNADAVYSRNHSLAADSRFHLDVPPGN